MARGDKCIAGLPYPGTGWPKGWDMCTPDIHDTTAIQEECCVAQCMETLLYPDSDHNASFVVCAGSDDNGQRVFHFDWAKQYCDCSFKEYCSFVCCPTCDTPAISSNNRVHGKLQSAGIMASDDNETDSDVYRFKLTHDSRNLCAVFFFAIFETGNQVVIDWTLSVMYMPYYYDPDLERSWSCEEIITQFVDVIEDNVPENLVTKKPQCGHSDLIENLSDKQCALRLPRVFFEAGDEYRSVCARYIAYTTCHFMVDVLDKDCPPTHH